MKIYGDVSKITHESLIYLGNNKERIGTVRYISPKGDKTLIIIELTRELSFQTSPIITDHGIKINITKMGVEPFKFISISVFQKQ
jgi:hypothetical protein